MNKNVFNTFLVEEVNIQELDEALPKALAKAYENSGISLGQRNMLRNPAGEIDYQNAEYEEISPEAGKELWKNDPQSLILIITDDSGKDRAVKFREDGKVDIDPAYGNYRFNLPRDKAYIKRDGTAVRDVFKAKINHLLSIAKKIYRSNERLTKRDQNLLNTRRSNPESPKNIDQDIRNLKQEYTKVNNVNRDLLNKLTTYGSVWEKYKSLKEIPELNGIHYDPESDTATWDSGYGGTGKADFWLDKFLDYYKRWSAMDTDTFYTWLAYLLASQHGNRDFRIPTEKEIRKWYNITGDPEQDLKARLRYYDVEKVLQEPKERVKQAIKQAKEFESLISREQERKAAFSSPASRSSREADINYYIGRYKNRLLEIIKELERYESQLDELDAKDAKKIQEFDDKISDLTKQMADAKQEYTNTMANGAYTNTAFGRKVPESLEEEKSLDELVDVLNNRRLQNEDLTEDFDHNDRKLALAEYLDVDPEEIDEFDEFDFDTPDGEFLVLTDDEAHDRAVDEIKIIFDDMGVQAFTPNFQKEILRDYINDAAIDEFIDGEIEYFETQEDDPEHLEYLRSLDTKESKLEYIKDVFGDLKDFVKSDGMIDIDGVAEEAINQDGIAHFIAYYDGEENELGNGFLAYRIN